MEIGLVALPQTPVKELRIEPWRRDLELFCDYVEREEGKDSIAAWSPRTSRAFQESLTREIDGEGGRLRKRKIKHAKA